MHYTLIALGVALVVLGTSLRWARARRASRESREVRCRRDIQALRRKSQARAARHGNVDTVWSAGANPDPAQSRGKKTVAWVAAGTVSCGGGCGGGCGGCGGCGG